MSRDVLDPIDPPPHPTPEDTMTSPDRLLSAIRAALDDTERLAQQVADRYVSVRDGQPLWPLPTVRARFRDSDPGIAAGLTLIEMFNPAAVLRLVVADRRVLQRHLPEMGIQRAYYCRRCHVPVGDPQWPCEEILDLADRLGIDPEETP